METLIVTFNVGKTFIFCRPADQFQLTVGPVMSDNSFNNLTHFILCVTLSFTYKSSPGPLTGFKENGLFLTSKCSLAHREYLEGDLCRVL